MLVPNKGSNSRRSAQALSVIEGGAGFTLALLGVKGPFSEILLGAALFGGTHAFGAEDKYNGKKYLTYSLLGAGVGGLHHASGNIKNEIFRNGALGAVAKVGLNCIPTDANQQGRIKYTDDRLDVNTDGIIADIISGFSGAAAATVTQHVTQDLLKIYIDADSKLGNGLIKAGALATAAVANAIPNNLADGKDWHDGMASGASAAFILSGLLSLSEASIGSALEKSKDALKMLIEKSKQLGDLRFSKNLSLHDIWIIFGDKFESVLYAYIKWMDEQGICFYKEPAEKLRAQAARAFYKLDKTTRGKLIKEVKRLAKLAHEKVNKKEAYEIAKLFYIDDFLKESKLSIIDVLEMIKSSSLHMDFKSGDSVELKGISFYQLFQRLLSLARENYNKAVSEYFQCQKVIANLRSFLTLNPWFLASQAQEPAGPSEVQQVQATVANMVGALNLLSANVNNNAMALVNIAQDVQALGNLPQAVGNIQQTITNVDAAVAVVDQHVGNNTAALGNQQQTITNVDAAVAAVDQHVGNNTAALGNQQQTINAIRAAVAAADQNIANNAASLASIGQDVQAISASLGQVQQVMNGVSAAVATTDQHVTANTATLAAMGNDIQSISAALGRAQQVIDGIGDTLATTDQRVTNNAEALENMGHEVQTISAALVQLQQNVSAIGTAIATADQHVGNNTVALEHISNDAQAISAAITKVQRAIDGLISDIAAINQHDFQGAFDRHEQNVSAVMSTLDEQLKLLAQQMQNLERQNAPVEQKSEASSSTSVEDNAEATPRLIRRNSAPSLLFFSSQRVSHLEERRSSLSQASSSSPDSVSEPNSPSY